MVHTRQMMPCHSLKFLLNFLLRRFSVCFRLNKDQTYLSNIDLGLSLNWVWNNLFTRSCWTYLPRDTGSFLRFSCLYVIQFFKIAFFPTLSHRRKSKPVGGNWLDPSQLASPDKPFALQWTLLSIFLEVFSLNSRLKNVSKLSSGDPWPQVWWPLHESLVTYCNCSRITVLTVPSIVCPTTRPIITLIRLIDIFSASLTDLFWSTKDFYRLKQNSSGQNHSPEYWQTF